MGASMWQGLAGYTWGFLAGSSNGSVTLPASGLILLGFCIHTAENTATMTLNGTTIDLPTLTFTYHFNHLACPLTSLAFANLGANDTWFIEYVRPGS